MLTTRIKNLLHHFDDLKKAHDAVLRAKDQIRHARTHPGQCRPARCADSPTTTAPTNSANSFPPGSPTKKLQLSEAHLQELDRDRLPGWPRSRPHWPPKSGRLRHELADLRDDIRNSGGGRIAAIEARPGPAGHRIGRPARSATRPMPRPPAILGLQAPEDQVVFDANPRPLPGDRAAAGRGQHASFRGSAPPWTGSAPMPPTRPGSTRRS